MSFAAVNTFTSFLVPLTRHKKESTMAFTSGFPVVYPKSQLRISHFTSPWEVGSGLNHVRTRQIRKDFHYSFRVGTTNCIEQNDTAVWVQDNKWIPSYFTIANRKKNTQLYFTGHYFSNMEISKSLFILYVTFIILLSFSYINVPKKILSKKIKIPTNTEKNIPNLHFDTENNISCAN